MGVTGACREGFMGKVDEPRSKIKIFLNFLETLRVWLKWKNSFYEILQIFFGAQLMCWVKSGPSGTFLPINPSHPKWCLILAVGKVKLQPAANIAQRSRRRKESRAAFKLMTWAKLSSVSFFCNNFLFAQFPVSSLRQQTPQGIKLHLQPIGIILLSVFYLVNHQSILLFYFNKTENVCAIPPPATRGRQRKSANWSFSALLITKHFLSHSLFAILVIICRYSCVLTATTSILTHTVFN